MISETETDTSTTNIDITVDLSGEDPQASVQMVDNATVVIFPCPGMTTPDLDFVIAALNSYRRDILAVKNPHQPALDRANRLIDLLSPYSEEWADRA